MFVNDKDYVLDTSNTYFVYKCAQWICVTETSVCKFNGVQSTRKVKQFRRVSFENGNRQTWFDLYVSESVYNQMHMHILLYYVCHAVQLTEIALNWRCENALKCKILKGKHIKYINLTQFKTPLTQQDHSSVFVYIC